MVGPYNCSFRSFRLSDFKHSYVKLPSEPTTMSLVQFSVWSVLLFLLTTIVHLFRNKHKPGLKSIPGPPLAAYTGFWRFWVVSNGHAHEKAIELHQKYGKLVRIGPNFVSVGDASAIPLIYNIKGEFTKTAIYSIISFTWRKRPQANLFSTRSEAEHREQKRKVANAYSLKSLLKMEAGFDDCSRLLMSKLGEYADAQQPVDLGAWL